MDNIPIVNNIKDRFKRPSEDENENGNSGEQDVLEQFRIPATFDIPEKVFTPKQVAGVKFSYSKPRGFAPQQVEKFYAEVQESLKFYVNTLEKRDRHIHKLATEVDKYKTDFQNTKYQLELFQGAGKQAVVAEDGGYVSESDVSGFERQIIDKDSEILELQNEIMLANKDKSILEQKLNESKSVPPNPHSGNEELSSEEANELQAYRDNETALKEWEEAVEIEYGRLESELETLRASSGDNSEVQEALAERDAAIADLENQIAQLSSSVEENQNSSSSIQELQSRLETREAELEEAIDVANEVEAERARLEQEGVDIDAERVRLAQELSAAQEELQKSPELNESTEDVDALNEHIASLDSYIDNMEKHVVTIEESNTYKEQEIDDLRAEIEEVKNQLEQAGSNNQEDSGPVIPGYQSLPPGVRPEDLLG